MSEVSLIFGAAEVEDAVQHFRGALAGVSGVRFHALESDAEVDKWGKFESAEAVGFTILLSQGIVAIKPALLLWLGQGKTVRVKRGDNEVLLENLDADEVDRVLRSIEDSGVV